MSLKTDELDLNDLLASVAQELDTLIKSETDKKAALNKKEESSKEKSKEESSKEESSKEKSKEESSKEQSKPELKKDEEGSGHTNQSPEIDPQLNDEPKEDSIPAENPQQEDIETIESIVSGLDDNMLNELKQKVEMELQNRQQQQQPPQEEQAPPAPQPEMAPSPEQSAMKSEVEELKNKLAKSEESAQKLEKAFIDFTKMLTDMKSKQPVIKSVTDIKEIQFVDKGNSNSQPKELQKSELTDSEILSKATTISKDQKKLASLTKSERDSLLQYLISKDNKNEVLQFINK